MNNLHSSRISHTLLIIYLVNKIICCINLLSPFEKFISTPSPVHKESEQRFSNTVKRDSFKANFNDTRKSSSRYGFS